MIRRTRLERRTPIRKRSPKRAGEWQRIYGSKDRVRWVASLPCLVCVALHPVFVLVRGKCHNAHTVTGGMGRKADYTTIVPLCPSHRRSTTRSCGNGFRRKPRRWKRPGSPTSLGGER